MPLDQWEALQRRAFGELVFAERSESGGCVTKPHFTARNYYYKIRETAAKGAGAPATGWRCAARG
eukprot:174336-Prorocentrum_minimum.AAC.2